jgi:hypothetical protein
MAPKPLLGGPVRWSWLVRSCPVVAARTDPPRPFMLDKGNSIRFVVGRRNSQHLEHDRNLIAACSADCGCKPVYRSGNETTAEAISRPRLPVMTISRCASIGLSTPSALFLISPALQSIACDLVARVVKCYHVMTVLRGLLMCGPAPA